MKQIAIYNKPISKYINKYNFNLNLLELQFNNLKVVLNAFDGEGCFQNTTAENISVYISEIETPLIGAILSIGTKLGSEQKSILEKISEEIDPADNVKIDTEYLEGVRSDLKGINDKVMNLCGKVDEANTKYLKTIAGYSELVPKSNTLQESFNILVGDSWYYGSSMTQGIIPGLNKSVTEFDRNGKKYFTNKNNDFDVECSKIEAVLSELEKMSISYGEYIPQLFNFTANGKSKLNTIAGYIKDHNEVNSEKNILQKLPIDVQNRIKELLGKDYKAIKELLAKDLSEWTELDKQAIAALIEMALDPDSFDLNLTPVLEVILESISVVLYEPKEIPPGYYCQIDPQKLQSLLVACGYMSNAATKILLQKLKEIKLRVNDAWFGYLWGEMNDYNSPEKVTEQALDIKIFQDENGNWVITAKPFPNMPNVVTDQYAPSDTIVISEDTSNEALIDQYLLDFYDIQDEKDYIEYMKKAGKKLAVDAAGNVLLGFIGGKGISALYEGLLADVLGVSFSISTESLAGNSDYAQLDKEARRQLTKVLICRTANRAKFVGAKINITQTNDFETGSCEVKVCKKTISKLANLNKLIKRSFEVNVEKINNPDIKTDFYRAYEIVNQDCGGSLDLNEIMDMSDSDYETIVRYFGYCEEEEALNPKKNPEVKK